MPVCHVNKSDNKGLRHSWGVLGSVEDLLCLASFFVFCITFFIN